MSELAAGLGSLSHREFRVGTAVNRAIGVFLRNAVPFTLVFFVAWLPTGLIFYRMSALPPNDQGPLLFAAAGLSALTQLIALAAIINATFQDMRGQPVRLGGSAARGLRQLFPLIGTLLLAALGVWLGILLLIVPGFMLVARWYVYAPVCAVERKGPLGSLERSAELTEGNRWKIFAVYLILSIAGMASAALVGRALGAVLPQGAALLASGIWLGVWSAFKNVTNVVIYHDLRVAKEGTDIESIASVFD
ncbi:MAG: hypothetical protein ACLPX9_19735 [Rhodomicrobium sp.]